MKSSKLKHPPARLRSGIAALVVAMSAAIGTGTVHAAGTASGTPINNLSTLNYSVGGTAQPAIGSSPTGNTSGAGTATTFVVDNRVNVAVATTDVTFVAVVPGALAQMTTFTVTNTGNAVQDFALTSAQAVNGQVLFGGTDNFNTGACTQFVESGATAGFQSAQDTATFIDELAADLTRTVYVFCDIPAGQVNNDNAIVGLIATARAGGGGGVQGAVLTETAGADTPASVDIVFGDAAGTDDLARNANHSSRSAYRVVSSTLTVTKTSTLICDPFNSTANAKRIPGSIVRWTITIANTGAASASLSTVTDTISALTTFDANLVTGAGGAAGCLSAAPGVPESAAGSGFKLDVIGDTRPGTYPKFFTTANDADGANLNAGVV
ncbi:MAG TPA: hypothetical protein VE421_02410, partial [Burkholderiaceae bacterium]|nr:hypothetical protein [Burkholderiaceae bacterium]